MADYCRQCWGDEPYTGDLAGLSTEDDTRNNLYPIVLCEGCGDIQVDHTGKCISNCIENHDKMENK